MDYYIDKFREYLELEKNYSAHTVLAYSNDLVTFKEFVAKEFEIAILLEVNYPHIRSWIVSLSDQNLSNLSINRKISALKAFYKFLLKSKQLTENPLLKHKALKSQKKIQIPFSEKEVDLVLNQIQYPDGFAGLRDKLIIDLFYTTGIRRAELINLKVSDVNISSSCIKVLGKRNKERILPLLPLVVEEIKEYNKVRSLQEPILEAQYLFISQKGVKINNSFVYRIINYYFSNVSEKVKKSPHILRHTFATHLLNNGANINSVKELLGHASLASTQVYTHNSLAELKKVYQNAHPRNTK